MMRFDVLEAIDLGGFYQRAPWAIDGVVYLIFFTGVAHLTVGRRFGAESQRAAAAVSGSVGLSLAVGAATLARRIGFTLVEVGGLAWLLLAMVLGYLVFDLCKTCGIGGVPAALVAIVAMILGVSVTQAQRLVEAIGLGDVLGLVLIACVVALAWNLGAGRVLGRRSGQQLPIGSDALAGTGHADARQGGGRGLEGGDHGEVADAPSTASTKASPPSQDIASLLVALYQHFSANGFDVETLRLVGLFASHDRAITHSYRHVVRALSARRWRASTALTDDVAALMIASRDNVSDFDRAVEVALQACKTANSELFLECLQRLTHLEKQAYALLPQLHNVLGRLDQSEHSEPAGVASQGSGTQAEQQHVRAPPRTQTHPSSRNPPRQPPDDQR